jgi:hypothetical protein
LHFQIVALFQKAKLQQIQFQDLNLLSFKILESGSPQNPKKLKDLWDYDVVRQHLMTGNGSDVRNALPGYSYVFCLSWKNWLLVIS